MSVVDPVGNVLSLIESVKVESEHQWIGKCPCPDHDDVKPSLCIGLGDDGRVLLHCQAGCPFNAILEALQISASDLYPSSSDPSPNGQRQIVATYDYTCTFGSLLFQVVRFSNKDFLQRRPDGDGGWIWNVKGVEKVLYRLQELTRSPADAMIYIVEGEKDVDRLHAAGLIGTCSSGGAGKARYTDDTPLHDRHVAIIPDCDEAGHKHAQDVAERLHGKAKSVRIIELPGLAEHGDVSDWLDAGGDPEDMDRLASQAPLWEPSTAIVKVEAETALVTVEPYRTAHESMSALDQLAGMSRKVVDLGNTLAVEVSLWLDRRGVETLFQKIEHPIPYAAAALKVSVSYFHKLGQIGRVLRCLPPGDSGVLPSKKAILPLARLLENNPKAIPEALATAHKLAKADADREGREKPRPVRPKHTAAAVAKILGPVPVVTHTPVKRKKGVGPHTAACVEIRKQIFDLADAIADIPTVPNDIREVIVKLVKHDWCRP